MTVNKRKKNSRLRGSHTHGWGAKKKHRGKGNKGGSGNSGSGKRSDARNSMFWDDKKYFGKYGFRTKGVKHEINAINIAMLEQQIDSLVLQKKANEEKGVYHIKLSDLGYNKLLASGKVTKKFKIETQFASKSAEEKVKEAGGEVVKQ